MYNNEGKSVNIEFLYKIMNYLGVSLTDIVKDSEQIIEISFSRDINTIEGTLFFDLSAFINNEEIFSGELGFLPDVFIQDLKQTLYRQIDQEDKNGREGNTDVFYLLAEPRALTSGDIESLNKYQVQNDNFTNLISKIGKKNANRLINRLLVEVMKLETQDSSEQELTIIRLITGDLFLFLMEGKTITPFSLSKDEKNDSFPKVVITNKTDKTK